LALALFRLLDITKPGPIDTVQRLQPPGLGIMATICWPAGGWRYGLLCVGAAGGALRLSSSRAKTT